MEVCYKHINSDYRFYQGWKYSVDESKELISGQVCDNLFDQEEKNRFIEDLADLAGLPSTGFDSERILADIQSIFEENLENQRVWRIGEAFAEVA
jgi:hypothetical protein